MGKVFGECLGWSISTRERFVCMAWSLFGFNSFSAMRSDGQKRVYSN